MKRVVGGFVSTAIVFACSSGPAQGAEGGACFPNGTCNTGLTCLSNLCVNATADSGPKDADVDSQQEASMQDSPSDVATNDATDASSFSPAQLSGLAVWLRADKGVVTTNLTVTTWADQSPNHNDFVGNTCSLVSTGINGLPTVNCIGNGSLAVTNQATTIGTGAFTIEIVADQIANNIGVFLTSQGNQNQFTLETSSTKMAGVILSGSPVATATGTTVVTGGSAHILGFVRDANGTIALRTDGAPDGTSASNGGVDLGGFAGSSFGHMRIAEMVFVVGTLTTPQTADLEAYLKARYGL